MEISKILSKVDHTNLSQSATFEDIKALCDDGMKFSTASVCIPPCYVKTAAEYVKGKIKICTVIGFPNGYNTTAVKVFETGDAVQNGADEIDMVINIGLVKQKKFDLVLEEIRAIREACGDRVLKVIIETCLLNKEEKIKMCEVVSASGADFIKTSTGFSTGGATFEDIILMKKFVTNGVKIKAAGGIASIYDAEKFIQLGADRLGTSKVVKIAKTLHI